jgi:hypothetical protein
MVWLEPTGVHAGGRACPFQGPLTEAQLTVALGQLPPGPSRWVVDDAWAPALLLRDLAEVPSRAEAREAFFRWRYSQSLGTEAPQFVQALALPGNAWLLAGMPEELRNGWLQAAHASGHPIRSLTPRWLWLYNRLARTLEGPGLLLSLRALEDGTFSGTLAVWGQSLILVRQWSEPVSPEAWNEERVLPTLAYLARDNRAPQDLHLWGAQAWPESPLKLRIMPPELPAQEAC